jgi:3-phosphoshikimate 1-carboxyvinyltransferase
MSTFSVHGGHPVSGRIRVPGDKSISHRALLLAARAEGTSHVTGLSNGEDVLHTAGAVQAMGAIIDGDRITGGLTRLHEPRCVIDVGNSGTGIRLLAGYCAAFDWLTVLEGDDSIAGRPMDRVADPLRLMGASVDGRDGGRFPPLVIRGGGLHGIEYTPPMASAQVKSCVLLAGLGADGPTVVHEPVPTRAHTEEMLAMCRADITVDGATITLRPSPLEPFELDVPGDPSQAAFWIVAACIVPGSELTVENVYTGRGRSEFIGALQRMGADVTVDGADVHARYSPNLHGTDVRGEEVPGLQDEIPVLAVAAAVADGTTTFGDAAELRVKETDRVVTTTAMLEALGARAEPQVDGLVVHGRPGGLRGGTVESRGDHRIAMAAAVAALTIGETTTVEGWEAVATSYPGFEEDLRRCVS